jgi:hypothetical protein
LNPAAKPAKLTNVRLFYCFFPKDLREADEAERAEGYSPTHLEVVATIWNLRLA